jgi:hypothetical protein
VSAASPVFVVRLDLPGVPTDGLSSPYDAGGTPRTDEIGERRSEIARQRSAAAQRPLRRGGLTGLDQDAKEVIDHMSKIRRVIVGTLATGVLVVGGLGVGNAWAQSSSTASPSPSRGSSSSDSGSQAHDCPNDDSGNASSSTASLSL